MTSEFYCTTMVKYQFHCYEECITKSTLEAVAISLSSLAEALLYMCRKVLAAVDAFNL